MKQSGGGLRRRLKDVHLAEGQETLTWMYKAKRGWSQEQAAAQESALKTLTSLLKAVFETDKECQKDWPRLDHCRTDWNMLLQAASLDKLIHAL